MTETYQTNPAIEFDVVTGGDEAASVVVSVGADSFQRVPVPDVRVLPILERAFEPASKHDLVTDAIGEVGLSVDDAEALVEWTIENGLLLEDDAEVRARREWLANGWTASLRYYLASAGWEMSRSTVERTPEPATECAVELPEPEPLPDRSLGDVLRSRRTCRAFDGTPTSRTELGTLLGTAFGRLPGDVGPETAEYFGDRGSAFAVYPVVIRAEDVDAGVYRYGPEAHGLARVDPLPDDAEAIDRTVQGCLVDQPYADGASVVCILTADLARYRARWTGEAAFRQLLVAVAAQCHRLLLSATALGLDVFQATAVDDEGTDSLLGVDGYDEAALYPVAVGRKDDTVAGGESRDR